MVSATVILGNCLKIEARDCPSGLVVKNLLCSAGDLGLILGPGTKIPGVLG